MEALMRKKWRCFYCDEVFTSTNCAAEHFGTEHGSYPACQIKTYEKHLVKYIRKLEKELSRYRAEDSDVMRSIMSLEADHRHALRRSEEQGYNKGVRDMQVTQ
jgi:hypothetical protein